ncbi:hypothetical protein QO034_07865 [Sedimentitalea sp. JM2-8]|uniref:Uncharacterized protein n=1 Tax=Sedimentitalea xiamensis TaxID=3050037 RepID=A0ABT7FD36_9RHOB|nr:hypothetical protein [Sedimentitalea xiamensis]MDK3073022.1 hypothetical protein [Sedimentitalea xiamensis]
MVQNSEKSAAEETPAAGEAAPVRNKAKMAAKRLEKRKRIAEANKMSFILETGVRKFVAAEAKAAGMDVAPFLQKIVENHVMEAAPAGNPLAERLKAKRAVLDYAVNLARKVDADGDFDEHFIGNVMKKAAQDAEFNSLYQMAVGVADDNPKRAFRARAPLNQQLGRLIKRAAGAKSKRDDSGKIMRAQVQGELLSTYTLLAKAA